MISNFENVQIIVALSDITSRNEIHRFLIIALHAKTNTIVYPKNIKDSAADSSAGLLRPIIYLLWLLENILKDFPFLVWRQVLSIETQFKIDQGFRFQCKRASCKQKNFDEISGWDGAISGFRFPGFHFTEIYILITGFTGLPEKWQQLLVEKIICFQKTIWILHKIAQNYENIIDLIKMKRNTAMQAKQKYVLNDRTVLKVKLIIVMDFILSKIKFDLSWLNWNNEMT